MINKITVAPTQHQYLCQCGCGNRKNKIVMMDHEYAAIQDSLRELQADNERLKAQVATLQRELCEESMCMD